MRARSAGAGAKRRTAPFRSEPDMALFRVHDQHRCVQERARRRQTRGVTSLWQIVGVRSDGEVRVDDTWRPDVPTGVSVRRRDDRWSAERWDKER